MNINVFIIKKASFIVGILLFLIGFTLSNALMMLLVWLSGSMITLSLFWSISYNHAYKLVQQDLSQQQQALEQANIAQQQAITEAWQHIQSNQKTLDNKIKSFEKRAIAIKRRQKNATTSFARLRRKLTTQK